ncbi:replicative DNA helicase [bacterium]|nr:replicative DNA helicase [bacterium]
MSLFDKPLPHSLDAEMAVLGAMLLDNSCIDDVASIIAADSFYQDKHKIIFRIMCEMHNDLIPVDTVTLSDRLKETDQYNKIGGPAYLTGLTEVMPSAANVMHYAKIVAEKYQTRNTITALVKAVQKLYDGEELSSVLDEIGSLTLSALPRVGSKSIKEVLHDLVQDIDRTGEDRPAVIKSGISSLDDIIEGFHPSDLVIIGGHTSTGKTSLMINIINQVAVKEGQPVGIFELEMPAVQIGQRILSQHLQIPLSRLRHGNLSEEQSEQLSAGVGQIAESSIQIEETPSVTLDHIRTGARRWKQQQGLRLLCVDYLQLMQFPKAERRDLEIGEVTKGLKSLAKELDITIILLSQLNRESAREGKAPQLVHLRDSGAIEQDADIVVFTHRPDSQKPDEMELIVEKHRNGPTGVANVYFNSKFAFFYRP